MDDQKKPQPQPKDQAKPALQRSLDRQDNGGSNR
jgi:hypothetical protein